MKLKITLNLALFVILLASCVQKNADQKHIAYKNSKNTVHEYPYQQVPESGGLVVEKPTGTFSQEERIKNSQGPVRMIDFITLTDEKQLEELISKEAMDELMEKTAKAIAGAFENVNDRGQIILQFTLYKNKKPLLGMAVKGYLKEAALNKAYNSVATCTEEMRTKKDSCVFQNIYSINEPSGIAFQPKRSPT